jgi:hypothetical protein
MKRFQTPRQRSSGPVAEYLAHSLLLLTGFINGWLHHKGTQGPRKHKANVTNLLCGFVEFLWCCGVNLVYETACRHLATWSLKRG